MSAFDWRGQPATVKVPDFSSRAHGRGRGLDDWAVSSSKTTPVVQSNLQGNRLKMYPSVSAAARDLGIPAHHIHQCVCGKREEAGGFRFALRTAENSKR